MPEVQLKVEIPVGEDQDFRDPNGYEAFFSSIKEDIASDLEHIFEGYSMSIKEIYYMNDHQSHDTILYLKGDVEFLELVEDMDFVENAEDFIFELESRLEQYIVNNRKYFRINEDGGIQAQLEWV